MIPDLPLRPILADGATFPNSPTFLTASAFLIANGPVGRQHGPMQRLLLPALLALVLIAAPFGKVRAVSPDTVASVVSVLPVWPGQPPQGTRGAPEGSGIALSPGVIATAWHVIAPAERIDVRLADGRLLPARLVAHDAATDIALLSVDADLPPFALAPAPDLAQPVCAVGNAFGLGLSVTCGVVSALGVSNAGFNPVEDFVQTDAAINPGFSGGALVDGEGRLVGMVSAIFASDGDANIGVNFAVSTDLLSRIADALTEGEVRFPDPGWRLETADRATRARVAAPVIALLAPSGPAEAAGLRPGDLVRAIAGRSVRTPRDAIAALALVPQDAPAYDVRIERDGAEQTLSVAFGAPSAAVAAPEPTQDCPHPAGVCRMRQAVFPISSFDPLGSATRIAPNLLVTNRHVIGDQPGGLVFTPDGPREAEIVPSSYAGDLVLLRVAGLPEAGHIPDLAGGALDDSAFYAVGADIAREEVRVFEPGTLMAGPAPGAALGRVHVTARMQPGVSGGALVGADGALAGIAVGGGDGRFEAVPIAHVQRLLDGRSDPDAAAVTDALGTAFATCAAAIDGGPASPEALEALANVCAEADNHGQLLEAGRLLAQAREFEAAAVLHGAAVMQVPGSINARLSLLVSLQLGARFAEMIPHARWVLENVEGDPSALRFAIQSGVWGGDLDLAEAGYTALLAADPAQAEAARRFIDNAPPAPAPR